MQAWFYARQWEALFAVAMASEVPDGLLYLGGAGLGVLAATASLLRERRWPGAGLLFGCLPGLLAGALVLLVLAAFFAAPLAGQAATASALRFAALDLAINLLIGAGLFALLAGGVSSWTGRRA